jgi:hypothetical protein
VYAPGMTLLSLRGVLEKRSNKIVQRSKGKAVCVLKHPAKERRL